MVGEGIKKIREEKGMQQIELAKALKTSQPYVSQIEGNILPPSLTLIKRIAKILEVHPVVFFWFDLKREKLKAKNRSTFDILKPSIDEMMSEIFLEKKED